MYAQEKHINNPLSASQIKYSDVRQGLTLFARPGTGSAVAIVLGGGSPVTCLSLEPIRCLSYRSKYLPGNASMDII